MPRLFLAIEHFLSQRVAVGLSFLILFYYQFQTQVKIVHEHLFGLVADDAFISMVYARNLIAGHGLTYNIGETVEGYTNYLWVLIMSVPYSLKIDEFSWIHSVGFVSSCLFVLGSYLLGRHFFGATMAMLIAAAIAGNQQMNYFSAWGLETTFFAALAAIGTVLFLKKSFLSSSLIFTLLTLTRLDGFLLFLPMVASHLIHVFGEKVGVKKFSNRWLATLLDKSTIKFLGPYLIIICTYFTWRWQYFGYFLPNTFYAKADSSGSRLPLIIRGLIYLWEQTWRLNLTWSLVSGIVIFVVLVFKLRVFSKQIIILNLILVQAITYITYLIWVGGDVFLERFMIQILPFLLISALLLIRDFLQSFNFQHVNFDRIKFPVVFVFIVSLTTSSVGFAPGTHLTGWVSLGEKLKFDLPADSVIGTDAAGAIKYFSELTTIDVLGLNDVRIAHSNTLLGGGTAGHEKQDNSYVLSRNPFVVTTWVDPDGGAGRNFDDFLEFQLQYELTGLLETSGHDVSPSRIKTNASEFSRCEASRLSSRSRSDIWDWGIWTKRKNVVNSVQFVGSQFSSPFTLGGACESFLVSSPTGFEGHLLYGPYVILPRGQFDVHISGSISKCRPDVPELSTFDVFASDKSLVSKTLHLGNGDFKIPLEFGVRNYDPSRKYEFRVKSNGLCSTRVDKVELSYMENIN